MHVHHCSMDVHRPLKRRFASGRRARKGVKGSMGSLLYTILDACQYGYHPVILMQLCRQRST